MLSLLTQFMFTCVFYKVFDSILRNIERQRLFAMGPLEQPTEIVLDQHDFTEDVINYFESLSTIERFKISDDKPCDICYELLTSSSQIVLDCNNNKFEKVYHSDCLKQYFLIKQKI